MQAVEPFVDAMALVEADQLLARELRPERLVAPADIRSRFERIRVRRQEPGRLDVEQLTCKICLRDLEVVPPLAVRQRRVHLAGLGVDEVRRQRSGVTPEERVRQRAVAPEEARHVQAHEELRQRVEQMLA